MAHLRFLQANKQSMIEKFIVSSILAPKFERVKADKLYFQNIVSQNLTELIHEIWKSKLLLNFHSLLQSHHISVSIQE